MNFLANQQQKCGDAKHINRTICCFIRGWIFLCAPLFFNAISIFIVYMFMGFSDLICRQNTINLFSITIRRKSKIFSCIRISWVVAFNIKYVLNDLKLYIWCIRFWFNMQKMLPIKLSLRFFFRSHIFKPINDF